MIRSVHTAVTSSIVRTVETDSVHKHLLLILAGMRASFMCAVLQRPTVEKAVFQCGYKNVAKCSPDRLRTWTKMHPQCILGQ